MMNTPSHGLSADSQISALARSIGLGDDEPGDLFSAAFQAVALYARVSGQSPLMVLDALAENFEE